MEIKLSDHFTLKRLICFVISPIMMMLCTSLYSIVDGIFVSNFVGKTPFAAVNLIMPFLMGVGSIGFMIGTGGSAIVAKTLGEDKKELANQYFSMLVYCTILLGILLTIVGILLVRPIAVALGATGELLKNCVIYGRISFISLTGFFLQNVFHSFFSTAERPDLSLKISIMAGLTNVFLDFLFIVIFHWEIAGAALATSIGEFIGGFIPIFYFARKNSSLLRLTKMTFHIKILLKACLNGASEMVTSISSSIVNVLYNYRLMSMAGENGVAAYGVIMYVNFIFMSVYFGYSIGSSPIISYHYGAQNQKELKNLFKKSVGLAMGTGIGLTLLAEIIAVPLVTIFANYDEGLFTLTCHGFRLYSLSFLMMGTNIWGSSFFTALNNGKVSAVISFARTFVFQIIVVMILPKILGINGIWLSVVFAECLAFMVTVGFFITQKKKYHYI